MVEIDKERFYWRFIAGFLLLVWVILLLLAKDLYLGSNYEKGDILTPTACLVLYGATIGACLLLLVFPLQFYIYTFFCCLWGFVDVAEGGNLMGVLMYGLGIFFAFRKGFFTQGWKVKLTLVSIPIIVALCSQLRYDLAVFLDSLLNIFGFLLIGGLVVFTLRNEIQRLVKKQDKMVVAAVYELAEVYGSGEVTARVEADEVAKPTEAAGGAEVPETTELAETASTTEAAGGAEVPETAETAQAPVATRPTKAKELRTLSKQEQNERMVQAVRAGESYKSIARQEKLGESTVKRRIAEYLKSW